MTHSRNLQSKVLRATTFINSPLTGRQIDVEYTVEDHEGVPTAFLKITLPTAAASVGHNYAHAGLASVRSEVEVSAALVRVTLAVLGFTPDEIKRFMKGARCQHLELTWHTPTASRRARLSLQNRTIGLIQNGTWGPVSAKQMQQLFSEMKQMNVLEPVVTIKSSVKEDSLAALCALKDRILASCTK